MYFATDWRWQEKGLMNLKNISKNDPILKKSRKDLSDNINMPGIQVIRFPEREKREKRK